MTRRSLSHSAAVLLIAGSISLGFAGCGSDDETPTDGNTATDLPAKQSSSPSGEVKPKQHAPESADDKRDKAPDDVISDRPGGPAK